MRESMRSWWLGLALLLGCDRGIEANQDNLTHFAAVASDLRRDARELELLASKVEGVQKRLEQRKSDIAEHVLSQEMAMRRDRLLARLRPAAEREEGSEPAAPSEPSEPSEPASTPTLPDPKAIPGALALHEELITPLDIADDSLRGDNDYWWWLEELGLQSADTSNLGDEYLEDAPDELERSVEDCRTSVDQDVRMAACSDLLANHLTTSHFDRLKKQRQAELDLQIARLDLIKDEFADAAKERSASAEKVMAAYGSSFDGLIIWGFPALIIAVLIIVLFEGRRRKAGEQPPTMDTLAVVTVLLLVSAIIILGLGGKIQPEALGTLIGGISGYVLGKGAQLLGGTDKSAVAPPSEPTGAAKALPAAPPEPATAEASPSPTPPSASPSSTPSEGTSSSAGTSPSPSGLGEQPGSP
jgi:hypothetical protein